MKTFRLHLRHGLSGEQYERLVARFGACRKLVSPVKGGGRNLVVALDVHTDHLDAAEHFAANRVWSHKSRLQSRRSVRVHVARIEEVKNPNTR